MNKCTEKGDNQEELSPSTLSVLLDVTSKINYLCLDLFINIYYLFVYSFIWLHQLFVTACRIFSCTCGI